MAANAGILRMVRWPRYSLYLIGAAVIGSGCGTASPDESCTLELRIEVEPGRAELRVGESFQAAVGLSSCGGHRVLTDRISWSSSDPLVLEVAPVTGQVRALAAGSAEVRGVGETYGAVASIAVTVQ